MTKVLKINLVFILTYTIIIVLLTFNKLRNNPVKSFKCDKGGNLRYGGVHNVCVYDSYIVKFLKPCESHFDFSCHLKKITQDYANNKHMEFYRHTSALADANVVDGVLVMKRYFNDEIVNVTAEGKKRNRKLFLELDQQLSVNGHIMIDLHPYSNVFIENSTIVIVDFNILPDFMRHFISYDKKIDGFQNLFGSNELLEWLN